MGQVDPSYGLRFDIERDGQFEGYITTYISKEDVLQEIRDTVLDSGTVLFISLLFLVELLILMLPFLQQQVSAVGREYTVDYGIMRPAAFLFLFGIDIGISFIPLHMENLYQPILGLSKDMVMGIPISARVLSTGISILMGGNWGDRRGWHEPFLTGLCLAGIGFVYAWLAPDAIQFIVSQAVFGFGYGLSLIAAQVFVIAYTTDSNRARGLAQLWAGVYAGSICGGAAGAMLAERIGYSQVFLVGAVILFLIIPYTMFFMRHAMRSPRAEGVESPVSSLSLAQLFRFLTNRNISCLILFSSFPTAVALVGFLNYFSPVYLNRVGASQSNIGRVLMIYGVCLIYLAPYISKYVDASKGRKGYIVVSGVLGSMAFIAFHFFKGLPATALTVLLLGLSSSFGLASQSTYALKLKVTRDLGPGKAMGIYSSANRLGQVLGPITFGWLLMSAGGGAGVIYFGLIYLLVTLLFFIFAQNDGKVAATDD
jgi:predicted MFS family arabinose efflux permease